MSKRVLDDIEPVVFEDGLSGDPFAYEDDFEHGNVLDDVDELEDPDGPEEPWREPVGPRSRRGRQRRMRRRLAIVAAGVIVTIVAAVVFGGISGRKQPGSSGAAGAAGAAGPASRLTLFVVNDDPPLAAVIGTGGGRGPKILPMPSNVLTALPETGSGTVAEALAVSGQFGRTGISNILGTWIDHYVVIDTRALGGIVAGKGGLVVDLPKGARLGDQIYPGGPTKLTGTQVVEYATAATGEERALRWQEILQPLFASGVSLGSVQPVATDNLDASSAALTQGRGATLASLPVIPGEGGLLRADNPAIARMLSSTFGIDGPIPVRVIVLNGTVRPSAETGITEKLVPAGYRITAYGPAKGINHKTTLVIASVDSALPEAQALLKTLGIGRVFLGGEQSGLADITVVIGKDALRE